MERPSRYAADSWVIPSTDLAEGRTDAQGAPAKINLLPLTSYLLPLTSYLLPLTPGQTMMLFALRKSSCVCPEQTRHALDSAAGSATITPMFISVIAAYVLATAFAFCGVVNTVGYIAESQQGMGAFLFIQGLAVAMWPLAVAMLLVMLVQIACKLEQWMLLWTISQAKPASPSVPVAPAQAPISAPKPAGVMPSAFASTPQSAPAFASAQLSPTFATAAPAHHTYTPSAPPAHQTYTPAATPAHQPYTPAATPAPAAPRTATPYSFSAHHPVTSSPVPPAPHAPNALNALHATPRKPGADDTIPLPPRPARRPEFEFHRTPSIKEDQPSHEVKEEAPQPPPPTAPSSGLSFFKLD